MLPVAWLLLAILLAIFELLTTGLTTIWLAIGAAAAFLVALFGTPIPVQVGVFAAVAILMMIYTRPLAVKYLNSRTLKTNLDLLPGETALVTKAINNQLAEGTVMLNGMDWTARSENGDPIPEGTTVIVKKISGVKLIVSPK